MDDFPRQSKTPAAKKTAKADKPAKQEKVVEQVVKGDVIQRKMPLGRRIKELFFGGESRGVFDYVVLDVMMPAAKDMVADAVSQGVERTLFGEARSRSRRTGRSPNGHVSYSKMSGDPRGRAGRPDEPRAMSRRARANHDFQEIILATRHEADDALEALYDLVAQYEHATVADLYTLVGISPAFTDEKWGWEDLRGAGVRRIRDGYLLDLPVPETLDY